MNRTILLTETHAGNLDLGLLEITKSLALGATPARLKHRVPHAQNFAYFQEVDAPLDSNATASAQEIEIPAVDLCYDETLPLKPFADAQVTFLI